MTSKPSSDSPGADLPTKTHSGVRVSRTLPAKIGHYAIRRVIASGGMGVVYEATQEKPRRIVALKVMKHGVASRTAMRRFEFESQILARLRHSGIAQIFEAGIHDDGAEPVPFFAMEYIPNALSITHYAHEKKLDVPAKLRLFVQVCDAVNHGHLKGIIHRDLKPGNILIDSNGSARVIDFGVARGTDSDLAVTTSQTNIGELVGTLQYMSPEQCQADPHDLDTRSDVYALGVVLYELLTGRLPYDLKDTPYYEVPRVIREVPPLRLGSCDRKLCGDLETIVSKSLEKDRDRRYGSALSLSEDITRFLRREPIQARPIGTAYRAMRFVQRERKAVAVAIAMAVVGVSALVFYLDVRRTTIEAARRDARIAASREFLALQLRRGPNDKQAIIDDCSRAIESYPDMAAPYAIRAKMWTRQGQNEAARRDCQMALSLDPANSLALRTMAFLWLEEGEFERAVESFRIGTRTLWLDEYLPEDFHNRARLWRLTGDYERALADHKRAIALAPKDGLVYQGRGITHYFSGNIEAAIDDWSHASAIDVNAAVQCALWTWEARMLRNYPGDRESARLVLEDIRPDALTHPLGIAVVDFFLGNTTLERLSAAAPTPEDQCQMHYYVGSHALAGKRTSEAEARFRQCLAMRGTSWPEYDLAAWHVTQLERTGATPGPVP